VKELHAFLVESLPINELMLKNHKKSCLLSELRFMSCVIKVSVS